MKSIVVFASGKGSNAKSIIQHFSKKDLAKVSLIVCNNPNAGVIDVALEHNIPFLLVDKDTLSARLFLTQLEEYKPDLIVLAGFLWKIPDSLIQLYSYKIVNIHPALLPKYGGKGMYGAKVHQAVVDAGEKETGITIHYVNEHYDEGAHILQAHCNIKDNENALMVAEKVAGLEHFFFPQTIEYLLNEQ